MATLQHEEVVTAQMFELDFDQIVPGMRFTTRGRTITESDIVGFGSLTGDLHPAHTDAEWARESLFGERVAHGMLVMSYAAGLVPLSPERVLALRRIRDATFKAPARIGDTIRVEGEVADVTPLDKTVGQVSCKWKIVGPGHKTLVRARVDVLWRRRRTGRFTRNGSAMKEGVTLSLSRWGTDLSVDEDILPPGEVLL